MKDVAGPATEEVAATLICFMFASAMNDSALQALRREGQELKLLQPETREPACFGRALG